MDVYINEYTYYLEVMTYTLIHTHTFVYCKYTRKTILSQSHRLFEPGTDLNVRPNSKKFWRFSSGFFTITYDLKRLWNNDFFRRFKRDSIISDRDRVTANKTKYRTNIEPTECTPKQKLHVQTGLGSHSKILWISTLETKNCIFGCTKFLDSVDKVLLIVFKKQLWKNNVVPHSKTVLHSVTAHVRHKTSKLVGVFFYQLLRIHTQWREPFEGKNNF